VILLFILTFLMPSEDHSIFRAEILDQIVDDYMFDLDSLHGRKHPFFI